MALTSMGFVAAEGGYEDPSDGSRVQIEVGESTATAACFSASGKRLAFALIDDALGFVRVDRQLATMLESDPASLEGASYFELLGDLDQRIAAESLWRFERDGEFEGTVYRQLRRRDGSLRLLRLRIRALKQPMGILFRFIVSFEPILEGGSQAT